MTNTNIRNILLIGRTGSGKSTLANILINKNEEFEEIFKESLKSISETKNDKKHVKNILCKLTSAFEYSFLF